MSATYGVIEALRRFRDWMPRLHTDGQRVVYGAILSYFGVDGLASPSYEQLATLSGFHRRSVRRIVGQLAEIGALMRVGDRPVYVGGVAKGGRVSVWSIPSAPLEAPVGKSQVRPTAIPSAPPRPPKCAPEGAPLRIEKVEALDPSACRHRPVDEDGWCTACQSQVGVGVA